MTDQIPFNRRLEPLKTKYGGTKAREILNRTIRAECPGGNLVLDRINDWHKICVRLGWDANPEPVHVTAYRHLMEIADALEDDVRTRHSLPAAPPREDVRR